MTKRIGRSHWTIVHVELKPRSHSEISKKKKQVIIVHTRNSYSYNIRSKSCKFHIWDSTVESRDDFRPTSCQSEIVHEWYLYWDIFTSFVNHLRRPVPNESRPSLQLSTILPRSSIPATLAHYHLHHRSGLNFPPSLYLTHWFWQSWNGIGTNTLIRYTMPVYHLRLVLLLISEVQKSTLRGWKWRD